LYEDIGLGLTTWSPLASGLLTGKYIDGVPEGSRAEHVGWLRDMLTAEETNAKVRQFVTIADGIGCTAAQLALAWTASNPNVSTVMTGASRVEQVHENMKALDVLDELTPERIAAIEELFPIAG
jgi:aryl-alcohol dehydrogenase-like predicted oxidoreductase